MVGNVRQSIQQIYALLDNKEVENQETVIEMDYKVCDQVFSIFIDPKSNYSYVSTGLVDNCDLNK